MDGCERTGLWVERLHGALAPDDAAALDTHAAACAACAAERDGLHAVRARFAALPAFEASRPLWPLIESKLPPRRSSGGWLRFAAAAGILVALASFLYVGTAPVLPVVVGTATTLRWGERFQADRFLSLSVPGVGTLRLDRGSALRFESPRCAVLEAGEVFADIEPSGRGFEIRSAGAVARVHGTRFGVRAPETVYVVEGAVEVRSGAAVLKLGPRQVSVGARLAELSIEDHLQWLARHERPALRLVLDPREQTAVTPGAPLRWTLRLESDALAPLILGRPRDLSQYFSLLVNGAVAPIDAARVRFLSAAPAANGLVRCDSAHPVLLECAVDPGLFREKGSVAVRAVFTSGVHDREEVWVGTVRSPPVTVEVR